MSGWLGIDHGHKRIGVAVGNVEDGIATPAGMLPAEPASGVSAEIARLAGEYDAVGIVVGLPLNMDDTIGPQAIKARDFALELAEATGLDVRLWDERLSSFQADSNLAGHMTRKKRRARQDAIAAADFLGDFLKNNGPAIAKRPHEIDIPQES